jgi:ribonucleoside-diphosphate reductase subunit M1
MMKMDYDSD